MRLWRKRLVHFIIGLLSGILGILIGAIPDWYPIIKEFITPKFRAEIQLAWSQPGKYRLISCIGENKLDISDVTTLFLIKITNISSLPREIIGYYVEVKTSQGWKRFGRAPLINSQSFYIEFTDPNKIATKYFDFSQSALDIKAYSQMLAPGHSVTGWIFLNFYHGERPKINWEKTKFRMTIEDSRGDKTQIEIFPPLEDQLVINKNFKLMPKDWKPPCL